MTIWFYSIAIGLIALPWQSLFIDGLHPFDQKRLFQLAITFLALLLVSLQRQTSISRNQQHYLLLLSLCFLPSILLAEYSLLAATEWANMLGLFCGALLISQSPNAGQKIFLVAVVACGLYALQATAHLANSVLLGIDQNVVARLPGFSNIRAFNHWQTWTLPIIGALPFFHSQLPKIPRYWLAVLAIIWWALLYISAGRGTTLGVSGAAIFIGLWVGKPAWPWLKTLLLCGIAGFALGAGYVAIEASMNIAGQHGDGGLAATHSSARFTIWAITWQLFLDNIWFGVGGLHYAHQAETLLGSPHNLVLLTLAEHGALAGGLLLTLLAAAMWQLLHSLRHHYHPLALAYGCAIVAAAIHSCFSGVQLAPYSQLWLMLIIGAYWHYHKASSSAEVSQRPTNNGYPLRTLAAIAACLLLAGVAYTIIDPSLPDPWSEVTGRLAPRLWADGRF